ncbi:hypothetical protein ACPCSP_15055 [Streptomyces cinereoruber]|uniref:hypothetical protein n=1 Tax=Streptomyces cinereoruber TaxID=67260 RepID=UPI003C2D0A6C
MRPAQHMAEGDRSKASAAPPVAVLAADNEFHEELPAPLPHSPRAKDVVFAARPVREEPALPDWTFRAAYLTPPFTVPRLLRDRTGWSTATIGTGRLVALLAGSTLSMAPAAPSTRTSRPCRPCLPAILLTAGAPAPLTAALSPRPPLLLPVATPAVFTASTGQASLAVYATRAAPTGQRPTAIGPFNLCHQLGGAFGPAIAAPIALGD